MYGIFRSFQLSLFGKRVKPRRSKPGVRSRRLSPPQSDPNLYRRWCYLRTRYFPEQSDLDSYTVCWSRRRQKRVLGSCHIERRQVRVALELNDPLHEQWLDPLLYHEMCHAALGILPRGKSGLRAWHGPNFKALVCRHPETEALENWMRNGGWRRAVMRHRARTSRKANA